jgi:hypothetical protein
MYKVLCNFSFQFRFILTWVEDTGKNVVEDFPQLLVIASVEDVFGQGRWTISWKPVQTGI